MNRWLLSKAKDRTLVINKLFEKIAIVVLSDDPATEGPTNPASPSSTIELTVTQHHKLSSIAYLVNIEGFFRLISGSSAYNYN